MLAGIAVLSVRPGSHRSSSGYSLANLRLHSCIFPLEEMGPWGPFYQVRQVLAKGRHLLQISLKALHDIGKAKQAIELIAHDNEKLWAIYKNFGPLAKGKKLAIKNFIIFDCSCFIPLTGLRASLKCTLSEIVDTYHITFH